MAIFKVFYQENKEEVIIREDTQTKYFEGQTEEQVRRYLSDRNYNIESQWHDLDSTRREGYANQGHNAELRTWRFGPRSKVSPSICSWLGRVYEPRGRVGLSIRDPKLAAAVPSSSSRPSTLLFFKLCLRSSCSLLVEVRIVLPPPRVADQVFASRSVHHDA